MPYNIDDIIELILHHLVLSEVNGEKADANLAHLIDNIERMFSRPEPEPGFIIACNSCGAWVYSELIGPDGAGYAADGSFYCSDCRWSDEADEGRE